MDAPVLDSAPEPEAPRAASGLNFPVVGIGASAGGLAAVKAVLEGLPARPDMAFVVVLHLSPTHESNAAAILQTATPMPVSQVAGKVKIQRDHVYVIPPNYDLTMVDGSLIISQSVRPPGRHIVIDRFFRTLAEAHRDRAIGIVLSGTGADGSAGIARLKEQGGVVIAQSPDDAEYDGMPASAIATGKVDIVLPKIDIADRLVSLWSNARRIEIPDAEKVAPSARSPSSPEAAEDALREIMRILHARTGHDFKHYKRATVLRRIERRLQVKALPDLPAYRARLEAEPAEARALLDDMLIGVTQFFRDRTAFDAVEREALPALFETAGDETVRAWVPACSTGEEAYSIAMLLADEASRRRQPHRFTVFATDIDEGAVAAARSAFYPESIVLDVPPAHLRNHFAAEPGGYRISQSLRERVIFALHNVLRDPPFSRLDLIACRNLLIYLDRHAQQTVLEMFHFALRPGGYLFLGTSETVDAAPRFFSPVDKAMRLYRANPIGRSLRPLQSLPAPRSTGGDGGDRRDRGDRAEAMPTVKQARAATAAQVHQQLLEELAPPSVLVTPAQEIVHVSSAAVPFLRYAVGEPSHDLLRAVAAELRPELRTALFQALQGNVRVESPPVATRIDGRDLLVRIAVRPVRHPLWPGDMLLITFDESKDESAAGRPADATGDDPTRARLEAELQRKNEQLRTTIEQYEASTEELTASNEELQAINEELRSTTEELETSKEELQSTNEELITVNHELKTKIDEAIEVNDDLRNLITSSDIATVFVDAEMLIKRFTPSAAAIFNLISADIGRSLFDITHQLDYAELAEDARAVFTSLRTVEREVISTDGRLLLARFLPYRTTGDRIGGAVLNFVDVTGLRAAETAMHIGAERMALVVEAMTDFAILTLDLEGRLTSWSAGAAGLFGYRADEAIGKTFDILFRPEDRAAGVPAAELATARETGKAPDDRWMLRKDGTIFFASGVMKPLRAGGLQGYAKICRDMTSSRSTDEERLRQLVTAEQDRDDAAAQSDLKSEFLAVMSHELKHPLNLIGVNAQLLTTLPEAQSLPSVMRAARTIQRSVQGQARIIDDLLDLSRTNTGKLTLNRAPLLLVEAIQPCMTWALAESRSKGVRLYAEGLDDPIVVEGDPVRVEQIAWNLLSNAIKFSREGGTITVRVSRDGDEALLEVSDTGRGMSAAFLPHIFEMFKQADSATTRGEGGLGIGLALVKNLVEMHGGRVTAESGGTGRGATFRVWLPLHQRTDFAALDAGRTSARRTLAGARILVVDDTPDTLETFAYLLEHEGAIVSTANSGREALQLCAGNDFDLVVSDVGMPQMDGYELIAELRRAARNARVPAIALTGYGRPRDVDQALNAGFQAHVDKPVDFNHMRELMETMLAGSPIAEASSDDQPKE